METTARVVVVGGGAVGCSIAYHLARAGWSEIVLLERDELTSGSTWHAAGLLPLFNMSYAVSHIHDYSLRMYGEIGDETGLDPGLFTVGNLRMAQTQERMDEYRLYATIAETVGIPYEWLSPKEMGERWPLIRTEDLVGAIYHPTDGYINPADVTQAMAAAARKRGVRIHRKKHVESFEPVQSGSGAWKVSGYDLDSKEPFSLVTEHVVTATGNHGQATGEAIGTYIPAMPVEHQYVVTGESETLAGWRAAGNPEHPVIRDADAKWYVREERQGWILGPYEATAPAWAVWGVPEGFPGGIADTCNRAHRRGTALRNPPGSLLRGGRDQGSLQRSHLLHAGRQSAPRPRSRSFEFLVRRGVFLRDHRGGRCRPLSRAGDDRGRGRD